MTHRSHRLFPLLGILLLGGTLPALAVETVGTNFSPATSLDASDGYLYWEDGDDQLRRGHVSTSGSLVSDGIVDSGFDVQRPQAFAVSGSYVYWQEEGSNTLRRARIIDGSLEHVEDIDTSFNVGTLAVDMGYLYFVEVGSYDLKRAKIIGDNADGIHLEEIDVLDDDFRDNYIMAADGGHLYFKDPSSATLYRATPVPGGLADQQVVSTSASSFDLLAVESGRMIWREGGANLYRDQVEALPDWEGLVQTSLDTLLDYGRDVYGERSTSLIMSSLNLDAIANQTPPYATEDDPIEDEIARTEGRIIDGRFSHGGSNLWMDTALLKTLHIMSDRLPSSDPDKDKYSDGADAYVADTLKYASDSRGGLFWGSHSYYDAHQDVPHTMGGLESTLGEKRLGEIDMIAMAGGGSAGVAGAYGGSFLYWVDSAGDLLRGAVEGGRVHLSRVITHSFPGVKLAADDNTETLFYLTSGNSLYSANLSGGYTSPLVPTFTPVHLGDGVAATAIAAGGGKLFFVEDDILKMASTSFTGVTALQTNFQAELLAAARVESGTDIMLIWREPGSTLLKRATVSGGSFSFDGVIDYDDTSTLIAAGLADWSKGILYRKNQDDTFMRSLGSSYESGRFNSSLGAESQGIREDTELSQLVFDDTSTEAAVVIAAAGDHIYWRNELTTGGNLYRASHTGSVNPSRVAIDTNSDAVLLAAHMSGTDEILYWVDSGTTQLRRGMFDPGTNLLTGVAVISQSFSAQALAAYDDVVYWRDGTSCKMAPYQSGALGTATVISTSCAMTELAAAGDSFGAVSLFFQAGTGTGPLYRAHISNASELVVDEVVGYDMPASLLAGTADTLFRKSSQSARLVKRKVSRVDTSITETLVTIPDWEHLSDVDSQAVLDYVDMIWKFHVNDPDKDLTSGRTCRNNRHNLGQEQVGHAFSISAGPMVVALAYASTLTTGSESTEYLARAKCVADWHWIHRGTNTDLPAEDATGVRSSDGGHTYTSVSGVFASQLLRAYEYTGDTEFLTRAVTYIKAYDDYAWDGSQGSWNYWAMLNYQTGAPVGSAWSRAIEYTPEGYVDMWRINMFTDEFPLVAAEAALYAYQLKSTPDQDLLDIALQWAEVVERALPIMPGRRWGYAPAGDAPNDALEEVWSDAFEVGGTYAENYGRAISFFVTLFHETGDDRYLGLAQSFGREAVNKLWRSDAGLFQAHPHKAFYQSNGGVGILLYSLLQLEDAQSAQPAPMRLAF